MGELELLGDLNITTIQIINTGSFRVEISAEKRDEVVKAETNEGETVDQFMLRLKGMMKAMLNAPAKLEAQKKEKERQKQEVVDSVAGKKKTIMERASEGIDRVLGNKE